MVFGAPQNGQLSYELFSESTIASTSVPATDAPGVQSKASGSIIIYNTYSAQPWRLIAGTRLVNDIGNTYRLTSSVTIPGYKKPAGGALTPGKIAVSIIADQSGSQYNISRLDAGNTFTIPAYASSTKFAAIYGKSTGNITGGLSGSKKSISPAALASTTEALRSVAVSSLTARLKGKISAEYVVYDSAYVSKASVPTISGDKPKSAIVSTEVTVYAIALKKVDLILKLAGAQSLQIFSGSTFDPVGLTSLSFSITNIKDFMPEKKSNILVQMKGDLKLVGVIPVEEMKGEFAGISLSDTQKVMLKHSAVIDLEKSSGQVVPPWAKIPKDKSKIDITVQK